MAEDTSLGLQGCFGDSLSKISAGMYACFLPGDEAELAEVARAPASWLKLTGQHVSGEPPQQRPDVAVHENMLLKTQSVQSPFCG